MKLKAKPISLNVMITCFKCHGKKFINEPYTDDDNCNVLWNPRSCEICHGTGKITIELYESLQRSMRT